METKLQEGQKKAWREMAPGSGQEDFLLKSGLRGGALAPVCIKHQGCPASHNPSEGRTRRQI